MSLKLTKVENMYIQQVNPSLYHGDHVRLYASWTVSFELYQ